jgi:hypothetical protein
LARKRVEPGNDEGRTPQGEFLRIIPPCEAWHDEMRGFTLRLISLRALSRAGFLVRAPRLKYYLARRSFTLPDKFSSGASACLKGCPIMRVGSKSLEKIGRND